MRHFAKLLDPFRLFQQAGLTIYTRRLLICIASILIFSISAAYAWRECIVFVETKGEYRRRAIGLTSLDALRGVIATIHPWLEHALSNAIIKYNTPFLNQWLDSLITGSIVRDVDGCPEIRATTLANSLYEWTKLGIQTIWEQTARLALDGANRHLRKVFYESGSFHYMDESNTSVKD